MPRYTDDQKREAIVIGLQQGAAQGAAYLGCTRQSMDNWLKDPELHAKLGILGKQKANELVRKRERGPAQAVAQRLDVEIASRAQELRQRALKRREDVGSSVDALLVRTAEILKENKQPVYDKNGVQVGVRPLSPDETRSMAQTLNLLVSTSKEISGEALAEKLLLQRVKADIKALEDARKAVDVSELIEAVALEVEVEEISP